MEVSCSSTSLLASRLPTKLSSSRHASLASRNSLLFRNGGRGLYERSVSWVSRRSRGPRPAPRRLGCRCLFGLGVPELVVIAGVAALIFGPKQLPEIGRSIGKTVKSFQQAAKEFETELKKEPEDASKSPPPAESSKAVGDQEDEKELETSGKKESA